ncbi:proline and serine-rich protein 3 isoform X2 [Narcine bancroftii]|uniref:proline and serine-rich protein 3 isoform X2 n=1 Tax=Narcine bancroftii TaxID=1343680 RepID=UPI003831D5AF
MERAAGSALFTSAHPFAVPPLCRSYYYPSSPQSTSELQQARLKMGQVTKEGRIQRPEHTPPLEGWPPTLPELLDAAVGRSDPVSPLEESWPSSESSPVTTPETCSQSSSGCLLARKAFRPDTGEASGIGGTATDTSVIAKYIQRFRHAEPRSREQRASQLGGGIREFWWLRDSPPGSIVPNEDQHTMNGSLFLPEGGAHSLRSPFHLPGSGSPQGISSLPVVSLSSRPSLKMGLSALEELPRNSLVDSLDPNTFQLQEKANLLLERSRSSLTTTVAVSSEGIGSPEPLDVEETLRQTPCVTLGELAAGDVLTARRPALRPEEDILHQWRLRRKMELARHALQPLLLPADAQPPPLQLAGQVGGCIPDGDEGGVRGVGICGRREGDAPSSHVIGEPPGELYQRGGTHRHHQLPLCHQEQGLISPAAGHSDATGKLSRAETEDRSCSEWLESTPSVQVPSGIHRVLGQVRGCGSAGDEGGARRAGVCGQKKGELSPAHIVTEPPEEPRRRGGSHHDHRLPSCHRERGHCSDTTGKLGRAETVDGVSREINQGSPSLPITTVARPSQESSGDESCNENCHSGTERRTGSGHAPSSIQHVLGQVISETIFSPPPLRRNHKKPRKVTRTVRDKESASYAPPSHPQPSTVAEGHHTPEALTQLLDEAQESDGMEFEDDLLLWVLRQQRAWVRQQLREANERLVSIGCPG